MQSDQAVTVAGIRETMCLCVKFFACCHCCIREMLAREAVLLLGPPLVGGKTAKMSGLMGSGGIGVCKESWRYERIRPRQIVDCGREGKTERGSEWEEEWRAHFLVLVPTTDDTVMQPIRARTCKIKAHKVQTKLSSGWAIHSDLVPKDSIPVQYMKLLPSPFISPICLDLDDGEGRE